MRADGLKELEREIEIVQRDLEKNTSDLDQAIRRKAQVEESVSKFNRRFDELRKERQRALALGEPIEAINEEIRKAKEEHELEQDELIGLTKRIEELNRVRSNLRNQKGELERERLALLSIPLVKEFNEHAERMASVLSTLWSYLDQMGESIEANRIFKPSNGEALKVVPRLYLTSENIKAGNMEDYFRRGR